MSAICFVFSLFLVNLYDSHFRVNYSHSISAEGNAIRKRATIHVWVCTDAECKWLLLERGDERTEKTHNSILQLHTTTFFRDNHKKTNTHSTNNSTESCTLETTIDNDNSMHTHQPPSPTPIHKTQFKRNSYFLIFRKSNLKAVHACIHYA